MTEATATATKTTKEPVARGQWLDIIVRPQARVPTVLPPWWWVWGLSAGAGSVVIFAISVFFWLHLPSPAGAEVARLSLLGQVIVVVLSVPPSAMLGLNSRRLHRLLQQGTPAEDLPRADVISTMRLPARMFWIVWTLHILFALVFVGLVWLRPGLNIAISDILAVSVSLGFISATTQGYLMADMVRAWVSPLLLPRGRIDHLADSEGHLPLTYVWQHLALLSASLAIFWPLLVLTLLNVPGEPGLAKYILLFALFVVLTSIQVTGIMRTVAGGVGHLAARMEEVRDGNLDARASVFDLDTFGMQASHFNRMVEGLKQREQLKEAFGRYVTQQVADEILSGRVALGGELRTATVLFSDIRGFTTMSEKMTPQEVVTFLNEYLTTMVDCVIEHGGVLDKFIGDAVLAVFGVPVSSGSNAGDAVAAVRCAVAMGRQLDLMNERRKLDGKDAIQIGIGLHTGELVAGNIGSPRRMQYTVIGDTVNVGSRLESLTKDHARRTLLSGVTAQLVKDVVDVVEVGCVPLRGRDEQLVIFGLRAEVAA